MRESCHVVVLWMRFTAEERMGFCTNSHADVSSAQLRLQPNGERYSFAFVLATSSSAFQ